MSQHEQILEVRRYRPRLHLWVRASLVLIALLPVLAFTVAFWLDPYRDGKVWLEETHTQLRLPPCTFKELTGKPCPSCGMTSSFALAIRGDLWNAAQANWVGMLMALFGLIFVPWAVACALSGRLLFIRSAEKWFVRLVVGFVSLMFIRWAIVLALGVFDS